MISFLSISLRYRFEHLFDDAHNTTETEDAAAKWDCRFYETIDRCVQHHLRAIQSVSKCCGYRNSMKNICDANELLISTDS